MNWHYLARKALWRPTCIKARGSRLGPRARIINIGSDSASIRIGANSHIEGDLLVFAHGGRIEIGQWCFVGEGSRLWSGALIHVGDRVLIAHGVNVFDNLTHPLDAAARHSHFRHIVERGHPRAINLDDHPIRIEDDAWLGAGSLVLRGVNIGRGAIVAAGAVVTSDVPPMTVVAGNPARPIGAVGSEIGPGLHVFKDD